MPVPASQEAALWQGLEEPDKERVGEGRGVQGEAWPSFRTGVACKWLSGLDVLCYPKLTRGDETSSGYSSFGFSSPSLVWLTSYGTLVSSCC
ncbi:Deoxyribonuclease-2-Alpha [Manis pentadactyla]|nr:Deoxyribonuclease-2-Alpha [Manis pentadactyla]